MTSPPPIRAQYQCDTFRGCISFPQTHINGKEPLRLTLSLLLVLIGMTETTVNRANNGQYRTTVPKDIGDMFDLDGKSIEWKRGSARDKLEIVIVDD